MKQLLFQNFELAIKKRMIDILQGNQNLNRDATDGKKSIQKHDLDSKVIQQLEMNILQTMHGSIQMDHLFSPPAPESSIQTSTTGASSLTSQTSFTMESISVESISSTQSEDDYEMSKSQSNGCCSTPKIIAVTQPAAGSNLSAQLLPPQRPEDRNKITLVLDLDETLIHSSFLSIPHADYRFILGIDGNKIGLNVCVRPGCNKFIRELGSLYEIVIFTASCQVYADTIIDFIDTGHFVKHRLYRDSCSDFGGNYVKDLTRLNRPLEKIIIIDNSSVSYMLHPYNAIAITSWFDDPTDNELFVILEFLKRNHRAINIYNLLFST